MQQRLAVLTGLVMLYAVASAGPEEHLRNANTSLVGLTGIRVVVHYDAPINEQFGLSEQLLRSAVELRLKANDIRLPSEREWARTRGTPYLSVTVKGTQLTSGVNNPEYLFH